MRKPEIPRLSIRTKLLGIFCIQVLLPLLLMGLMFYLKIGNTMQQLAVKSSQDLLKAVELGWEGFSTNIQRFSNNLLFDLLYNHKLSAILNSESPDIYERLNQAYRTREFLTRQMLSLREVQSLTIIPVKKNLKPTTLNGGEQNLETLVQKKNLWEKARAGNSECWEIQNEDDKEYLLYARIIRDLDTYTEAGLLLLVINLDNFKASYRSLASHLQEYILILNHEGWIMLKTPAAVPEWSADMFGNIQTRTSTSESFFMKENKQLICYRKWSHREWYITSVTSNTSLLRDFGKLRNWLLSVFIPIVLLLSLLSFLTAYNITKPIQLLVARMKEYDPNSDFKPLTFKRRDELSELAENFNSMAFKIKDLVDNVIKEQLTRKQAELKALQAQINPHFLFNTLQAMSCKATNINAPELSEMIIALSTLMEVAIGRDRKTATLKEEMKYLENYILLMTARYPNQFRIEWKLDHKLLQTRVPHLILQPVIENAFTHGLTKSNRTGRIRIVTRKQGEDIVIEITDNGAGLDHSDLKRLNNRLSRTAVTEMKEMNREGQKSIGLVNVNRRLKLFFGDRYGLRIESNPGEETRVIITIPGRRNRQI